MFPTAVPKPMLSSADKIAIYMCSIIDMPSSEIASRFDRSPRYINIVIANKKREIPDLGKAMSIFFGVLLKNTAAEADSSEEERILRGEPEYRCQGITPQEMAVQASRFQRLKGKLKNAKLEIARLRSVIEDYRRQTQPPIFEGANPGASSTDTEVTPSIIDEMLRLTSVPKNQRRYSDEFYRFSFIFASLSPRAYRYARKHLILPAPSSLGRHFGATVHDMKQNLTQLKYVHRTLEAFLEAKNPECERIVATIGVDAFAFRLFLKQIVSLKKLQDSLSEAQIRALAPILEDKQILTAISEDQTCVELDESIDSVGFERPEDVTQDKIDALFDMYNNCFIYDSKSGSRPPQRPQADRNLVTFAEVSTLQRIFCTIVSYAAGFQLFPDGLRTDALGTHIVEEKIGQARQGMDNRWTRILSVISRNLVRSLMLAADGTDLHSSARLKTAGCCLDDHADVTIDEFDPFLVAQVMWRLHSSTSRQEESFITSFQVVKTWLSQINDVLHKRASEIGKMWPPNPSANASIMARLIQASKRADIASVIVSEEQTVAGSGLLHIENK